MPTAPLGMPAYRIPVRISGKPRRSAPADAPPLAGIIEEAGEHRQILLLRLDPPAPGIAHFFALPMGGQVYLPIRLYLHGEGAAAVVAREEPLWNAWMKERFAPAGGGAGRGLTPSARKSGTRPRRKGRPRLRPLQAPGTRSRG